MTLAAELLDHARASGDRAERLLALYLAGDIDLPLFRTTLGGQIVVDRERAAAMALYEFAVRHLAATGSAPRLPMLTATDPAVIVDRVGRAVDTMLAEAEHLAPGPRIHRLARSESARAAQDEYQRAMVDTPTVKGYRRGLEPDACQLCQWWARDGRVWPATYTMPRHTGCCCVPEAVFVAAGSIKQLDRRTWVASEEREAVANRNKGRKSA